jgi:hypothetical protein
LVRAPGRACESLLRQASVHLLKQHAWPSSKSAARWRPEVVGVLADAERALSPSMRQRIDLAEIYQRAHRQARDDPGEANALPDTCPFTLDELLVGDVARLVAGLASV